MELEAVSSSEDETQKILAMNLSHAENLIEAKKLKTPRMVKVVSLLLTNAREEKLKSEADLIESEKFADLVIIGMNGDTFLGVKQDVVEKTGMLDFDSDIQSGWMLFLIYSILFSILFLCVWIVYKYKSFKA